MRPTFGYVLSIFILFTSPTWANVPTNSPAVRALLAQDWHAVIEHIEQEKELAEVPIHRMIKAHAFMAINRNNEASRLFLSVDENDQEQWSNWTNLAAIHPATPVP